MKKCYLRVNEQRNILHEISKRKANWIGHILRKNCLLQGVIEGKIKGGIGVTGRRGRRRGKLLEDLKERRGYCHLKEEALDRTVWRAGFGRGFGHVVRETAEWMKIESLYEGIQLPNKLSIDRSFESIQIRRYVLAFPRRSISKTHSQDNRYLYIAHLRQEGHNSKSGVFELLVQK
jgi:hypothetical protein